MTEDETALVDATMPPTFDELTARKAALEQEAEALTTTLGAMWQQRQRGTLPREQYTDYLYYEDQLRVTLQELERLAPQLAFAQAEDKVTTGKAHYDRYCALIAQASERVCRRWGAFVEASADLATLIDEQRSPLELLTRADGQPMFELDSGTTTLQNMLAIFPGQPGFLGHSVIPFLKDPITVGQARAILAHVKGAQPFSETNVERYLAEYRGKDPQPAIAEEDL